MTVIVELMSNEIGHKIAQQLGQESLEALSAVYDVLERGGIESVETGLKSLDASVHCFRCSHC